MLPVLAGRMVGSVMVEDAVQPEEPRCSSVMIFAPGATFCRIAPCTVAVLAVTDLAGAKLAATLQHSEDTCLVRAALIARRSLMSVLVLFLAAHIRLIGLDPAL